MSAPMCDAFLVLAQAPGGISCFLMPRFLPDGTVNALRFQRLKDKLGNRSNASSEVEFQAAHAWLIGEEGRGVPTIIEMVTCTRLDCAVGSAGLMRLTLANAIHHCRHRTVFQRHLVDQPLMAQVLADLALDVEAATALSFRLARSFDRASDPHAAAWRRLMTPVTKYWVCKMGPALAYEAMECLGGNGYVEEGLAARLYRELPLNAIWEGSGNVMALDLLRVLQREPETVEIVLDDLSKAASGDAHLKTHLARVQDLLHEPRLLDRRGRDLAEALATLAAGTILRAHAPDGGGRRLHRHAAIRWSAPDLRPGPRLGRHAGDRRPRLAGVMSTICPRRIFGSAAGGGLAVHGTHDFAERTDEDAALLGSERRQQALIDAGCRRLDGVERVLALLREADGIHAGVAARALSLQQALLDQPSHDVGERGAVDPGLLDEARLADVRVLRDGGEDGILTRGEVGLARLVREQHLCALTGTMQQVQGRDVERT